MSKSYRIRTTPGIDTNIKINIDQDFDTLDILSLKMTQSEVYSSLCADFGVVVGRVFTNGGYGLPNVRVSIFIPIEDEDEDNPVISELYPYRTVSSRNDDGYRYNLLPKIQQHSGHTPTGTFPSKTEVLTQDHILEVYEKYYKFTSKTNDSGDFMLFGVPLGTHTIHYDLDLSDIGCQSQTPFDLVYQGASEELFENSYTFMASDNLDSLPQIISTQKTVNVEPFWGNSELCQVGITRSDFDLKERGVSIEPYSLFMGGTYTDSERNAVRVRCNVDNEMGEKCSLVTGKGDIEAIRFSGDYEVINGVVDLRRPILESVQLDSEIDQDGNFFVRVPMNLRYMTTDEFGYLVESKDPDIGIPTLGKYRFRLSLQDDSGGKKTYRGKFLVPQIKEHQTDGNGNHSSIDDRSYSFSTNIDDYPDAAIDDIVGVNNPYGHPNDYFYSLRYNRIYTVSGFINQYYNISTLEALFPFFTRNRNESFLGIKEIQPDAEDDCGNTNQYFPINDGVSNFKFKFLIIVFLSFLERVYLLLTQVFIDTIISILFGIARALNFWPIRKAAKAVRDFTRSLQKSLVRDLDLVIYPDCDRCQGEDNGDTSVRPPTFTVDIAIPDNMEQSGLEDTINSGDYEANLSGPYNFIEQYEDFSSTTGGTTSANIDDDLYISGITLDADSNYIFKVNLGNGIYGYYLIGAGTSNPFDVNLGSGGGTNSTNVPTKIIGLFSVITQDIQLYNNLYGQSPNTTVSGSAFSTDGVVVIDNIYRYATGVVIESTSDNSESGCEKYDVLYNHTNNSGAFIDGDMKLRAYMGNESYSYYANDPDGHTEYPDVFLDGNDNPCEVPTNDFNVAITVSVGNSTSRSSFKPRLAIKDHGYDGTASGYSEFINGVYTLVPAAGQNRALILDYSRRKRMAQLLCAGYISYTFVNSWLNGSLYFFQFRRRRGGEDAKFCKDLIYRKEDETGVHYYYRSTPYYNPSSSEDTCDNNGFVGLYKDNLGIGESMFRNQKEILYPTTLVDLGPRNTFISEICTDANLDVNCSVSRSIGSTSYQDITDLMEYVLMSKEVKEKGKLDARDLFKGAGEGQNNRKAPKALDGDIAQLLNFNSQAGIFGYEDEDTDSPYYQGSLIFDGLGPVGVDFVYSEDDKDTPQLLEMNGALIRLCINGVGNLTETTQEVPYYKWDKGGDGFGINESQDWVKNKICMTKYQGGWVTDGMLYQDPTPNSNDEGQYYYDNDTTTEIAYEAYTLPPIRDCDAENYAQNEIPLGGPFFFYFGLRTGKTSWNKFIDKFGPK